MVTKLALALAMVKAAKLALAMAMENTLPTMVTIRKLLNFYTFFSVTCAFGVLDESASLFR